MCDRMREVHLRFELDGDRVLGELHDENGEISAFSGWLDLLSALDSLATPVRCATDDASTGTHTR